MAMLVGTMNLSVSALAHSERSVAPFWASLRAIVAKRFSGSDLFFEFFSRHEMHGNSAQSIQ